MNTQDLNRKVKDFVSPVKTVVSKDLTIDEALSSIRKKNIHEKIIYFYVIDTDNTLLGVVSTRKLLLNPPERKISEIMDKSVVCLYADQTLHDALEFLDSHHLLALPVVDEEHRFLGVIDVDLYLEDSVQVDSARLRRDIFQLIGITMEEERGFSLFKNYLNRMPWITCNLFGGIACAIISNHFEMVLSHVILLAMFIPLLLTLSESISMQSVTSSMQLLRHKNLTKFQCLRALYRDVKTVFFLSLTCGVLVGTVSLFWGEGTAPALVIGFGILISVIISAFIGAAIPLLLHFLRWDPKVAAGPVVLMFADVLTTAFYLTLATWALL